MKKSIIFYGISFSLLLVGAFLFVPEAKAANDLIPYQIINLEPGWSIVSSPRVLLDYEFSVPETTKYLDIYVLDPTSPSGWKTLQGIGQTKFEPLYAYFINNKTEQTQTLRFNYDFDLSPGQRLFQRILSQGWNAVGAASPGYILNKGAGNIDTDNITSILSPVIDSVSQVVDFTADQSDLDSIKIGDSWSAKISSEVNELNDFREFKGYGLFVTETTADYHGFQDINDGLKFSISDDSLAEVNPGSNNQALFTFQIDSLYDVDINSLIFTHSGTDRKDDINNFRLYDVDSGELLSSTASINGDNIEFLNLGISYHSGIKKIKIVGDVDSIAKRGETHEFLLEGVVIGHEITIIGLPLGNAVTITTLGGEKLSVALASETPITASIPQDSDGVLFTVLNLTAGDHDVTVTGVKLKRTGLGSNSDFRRVYLIVDGERRGSLKSVNSSDIASLVFSSDTNRVVILAGETKKFYIYGAMNGTATYVNALGITEITSDAAETTGLPVYGNPMTISAMAAPDITYRQSTVASVVGVGEANVEVAAIRITNNELTEDTIIKSMTFKSDSPASGTRIATTDIKDFELYDSDYNLVAGPVQLSSAGYIKFVLNFPFTIEKGGSENEIFIVKCDIVSGPGRYIVLDIDDTVDIEAYGSVNNFRTDNNDSYTAQEVKIEGDVVPGDATLSVSIADSTPLARTAMADTDAVVLLEGTIRANNGAVTIEGMTVTLVGNDMDDLEYENLKVYIDDVLTSEQSTLDMDTNDTSQVFAFTDVFGVDGTSTMKVTVDANSTVDANDWIYASVSGSNLTAIEDSNNINITGTGSAQGNKVTFASATLKVTAASSTVSVTKVKGATADFIGLKFEVGTVSDITLKSIRLQANKGSATAAAQTDIENVTLYKADGTTVFAEAKDLNYSAQVNFTGLNYPMTAGSTMLLIVKGDISSGTSESLLGLEVIQVLSDDANGDAIDATDDGSTTISVTNEVNDDGITTRITVIDRGILDVSLDASSPNTHQVMANTTGDLTTKIRLEADYEDVRIKKLIFTAAVGGAADDEVKKLILTCDGTEIASTEAVVDGVATLALASDNYITLAAGTKIYCSLTTDYWSTNNSVADSGAVVQWTINDFANDIEAIGATNSVYAAVKKYNGTGVVLTSTTTTATIITEAIDTSEVAIDVASVVNINDGDLIKIGSEYMLVMSQSGLTLTVRRGVAGSTLATATNGTVVTPYLQKLTSNSTIVYSNLPTVSQPSQPSQYLHVGTFEAMKFTVADQTVGEEDIRLDEVVIRVDGGGIDAVANAGWYVTNAYLYNGSNLVDSITTNVTSSGDMTFTDADGSWNDTYATITGETTFTVQVEIALGSGGSIAATDTIQLTINNFGSADIDGAITAGDLDWEDLEAEGTTIQWIDTDLTAVQGNLMTGASS